MIDHLVYAVPDLATAIDDIERDWGVRPAMGGKHTGRGSHNALLSLGDGPYLELIAIDPDQADVDISNHPFQLANLSESVLRTFAVKAPGIDERVARARAMGFDPGSPQAMSRKTPEGDTLHWKLTRSAPERSGGGTVPFLIDWGDTPHPSATTPQGCSLVSLKVEHPDPGEIRAAFAALNIDVTVEEGPEPALIAVVDTPNGRRELR